MAVIEAARNLADLPRAGSEEFDHESGERRFEPVGYHLKEWVEGNRTVKRDITDQKGGTMRLGAWACQIQEESIAHDVYQTTDILERHRHRYEFNNVYKKQMEDAGMKTTGLNPDTGLVEIVEIPSHTWFVGVQYHPEYKSTVANPHPLFVAFVKAAVNFKNYKNRVRMTQH